MTAYRCLVTDGPVHRKNVLVAGGAGAVGHFAIELAKHAGARVLATVSGPEKAALASKAGADMVVNYRDNDAVGAGSLVRRAVRPGGRGFARREPEPRSRGSRA